MWKMFHEKTSQYDLQSKNLLMFPQTNIISFGNDSLVFRGSILWNCLPNDIKRKTQLLREVLKVGVERTANAKSVKSKDVIYNV